MGFHHNINFPKKDGPSIQILHWKSVIFDIILNFFDKPLFEGWPTDYSSTQFRVIGNSLAGAVNNLNKICLFSTRAWHPVLSHIWYEKGNCLENSFLSVFVVPLCETQLSAEDRSFPVVFTDLPSWKKSIHPNNQLSSASISSMLSRKEDWEDYTILILISLKFMNRIVLTETFCEGRPW